MRKRILTGMAALSLSLGVLAGSGGSVSADASGYCGASETGCTTSDAQTRCSGAGAFGAFGDFGDVRHDLRGGAQQPETGNNNSNLCGNPQDGK